MLAVTFLWSVGLRQESILVDGSKRINRMEVKDIFQQIQAIKDSNPVIVLGSGASISYGIPGMGALANVLRDYFKANAFTDPKSKDSVDSFLNSLSKGKGLEDALLDVKVTEEVENAIVQVVWNVISKADKNVYTQFVLGMDINLKTLFDHIIYNDPKKVVNVVSTNYDKIAEYAACQTNAYVNVGFTNGLLGRLKEDIISLPKKPENDYTGFINILKVHGSLDWFKKDGQIVNYPNTCEIPSACTPCIITPGTNKYERTQQEPHRQLLSTVDKVFAAANGYMCIGYGFNDQHVHPMLLKNARGKKAKILIVTKEITDSIKANVIDKGVDYIAIYSNGSLGTIFQTPDEVLEIKDKVYWNIEGLTEI